MTSTDETDLNRDVLEALASRAGENLEGAHDGRGLRVAIVCSRFNGGVTARLLAGALDALSGAGVDRSDISVGWVPGAFEIPLLALAYADGERPYDAVLVLGAVIRGDTSHYEIVAGECARGVQDVQLSTRVPVAFGVLTTENVEQALERSMPDETNKGREAALTALEMASVLRRGSLSSP
jgi:6,7-dimethyl-8-ribityllumazine synthase